MASRPAAGGGRHVDVAPERLGKWFAGFAERHGATTWTATPDRVDVVAADGARAECDVPFAPLTIDGDAAFGGLLAHAAADRRVGVLLVRLGGYAAGVFDGQTLQASKVGSKTVHGRNSNGGWSQHRYARRREGQVKEALSEAADVAVRILGDAKGLTALILGGESTSAKEVMTDVRLQPLRPLVQPRFLVVPDPKLVVLQATPALFRAVRIRVIDPGE
ncbi:MAG: hypothetical protein QOG52_1897 [Frankiaceae bacterium]|jgi:hypothetical protein|nr:hypothetical protein [Frankiaceae bacterium]